MWIRSFWPDSWEGREGRKDFGVERASQRLSRASGEPQAKIACSRNPALGPNVPVLALLCPAPHHTHTAYSLAGSPLGRIRLWCEHCSRSQRFGSCQTRSSQKVLWNGALSSTLPGLPPERCREVPRPGKGTRHG